MPNSNDSIRASLLHFLHEVHLGKVRSENGKLTGAAVVAEMRKRVDCERNLIGANLHYLVDTGHVKHILEPIVRNGQALPGMNMNYYRITSQGIDSLEGPSTFMSTPNSPGITITNQGGVTIVGSNNTVHMASNEVVGLLRELQALVESSKALTQELKPEVVADIQTIEAQLKKSKPNHGILRAAWAGVEGVVTAAEFTAVVSKITEFIGALT